MASAPNPDFGWVRVEVLRFNSTYVDASSISQFRSNKNLTFDGNETNVICEPCTKDELVCWGQQRVGSPEYTYMYETLFSKLRVKLPFSPFECHVLRSLNVAPTQLHPNSWGFVRCFEILCRSLGMKASVGRFFYFFEAKLGKEVGWLSLNSTPRRGIMTALMGSYKDFKDKFFRVRAAEHFPELFLGPNGARKFPLYWTLDPVPICGADRKLMSAEEQADVDVLERFSPLSCTKLLQLEHNTEGLQEYLVRMSPMSAEDLRVYFERASKSKRKASPEAAANDSSITHSSSSLIVRKVRKRCETEEDTVGVEIKGEQTRNSDDIEEKWRSILKDFDGLGQGEIESLLDKRFPLPDLTDVSLVSLCRAIQAFAVRSALLARTMEDEFDRAERDKFKMEKELERLMKKVAELEEEKSQWVAREKNLKAEKEKIENEKTEAVSALKAEKEKIENEKTKATKAVSALKAEKEKIENEKTKAVSALLTARKEAEKKIGMKDLQFEELKMEIALQYVAGFEKAVEQISFLHPRLDVSKVGPFKVIRDGRLSDPPSNRP